MSQRNDINRTRNIISGFDMNYNSTSDYYNSENRVKITNLLNKTKEFKDQAKFRVNIRDKVINPPKDYQYDDYGSSKIKRVVDNGTHKEVLLKRYEDPIGDPHSFSKALNRDLFMVSDVSIASTSARTKEIQRVINKKVGRTDNLLFIGNLLDKGASSHWVTLKYFLDGLTCKNLYLILGENDTMFVDDYYKLGFKYITDKAEKTIDDRKVIFSHFPMPIESAKFNIHGSVIQGDDIGLMSKRNHYSVHIGEPDKFKVHTFKDVKGSVK